MKNFNLKAFFALLILFVFVTSVDAQNKKPQPKKNTAKFINKTNMILAATGEKVKEKKVYTGYLKKASKIEKKGVAHFNNKEFKKATKKSYIARRYAFLAYKANGGTVPKKWRLNEKEKNRMKKLFKKKITDEELKKEVTDEEKEEEKEEDGVVEDVEETEGEGEDDGGTE